MAQYSTANALIDRIKDLAERGFSDPEIATQVGLKREAVGAARRRYGIPSAVGAGFVRVRDNPLPQGEAARLRAIADGHYRSRPQTGICATCRRLIPLANDRVPVHPAKGTTPQERRPCTGSWLRPADIDHEAAEPGAWNEGDQ